MKYKDYLDRSAKAQAKADALYEKRREHQILQDKPYRAENQSYWDFMKEAGENFKNSDVAKTLKEVIEEKI
ncbi:MAG: hypothetical protein LBM93_12235 [Oscillospiraceae bacterium]|nr:hypothetical protein [Oscillospiraceae bacterium]